MQSAQGCCWWGERLLDVVSVNMNITVSVTPTANAAIMLAVPMAKQATSILINAIKTGSRRYVTLQISRRYVTLQIEKNLSKDNAICS